MGETSMEALSRVLREKNFQVELVFDGVLRRSDRTKPNSSWFVGHKWALGEKEFVYCKFGDWATGETYEWKSSEGFNPEEIKEATKYLKKIQEKREEEKLKNQEEVSRNCEALWNRAIDRGTTPYLERKGLTKLFGARIHPDRTGNLIVPLRDTERKIWNLQNILPEKIGNGIDKIFTEGGRIKGLYHQIGELFPKGRIIIAEGFATGASIHEATGHCTVVGFNAGNLLAVSKAIREAYPEAQITLCGDNDLWSKKTDGTLWNVGREKAIYAAKTVGANYIFPNFKNLKTRPTDFNDLHSLEGLQTVKEQILNPPQIKELDQLVEIDSKTCKPKKITETQMADYLINYYEGNLISQDGELFKFVNTHWQHQGEENVRQIKTQLQLISGNSLKSNQVESAYKQVLLKIPIAPKNMFQPNPFFANFLNGTLSISKMPGELSYRKEFRAHTYSDYITNVIPLNYEPEKLEVNLEFLRAVDRIFEKDPDKISKIRALKEMFGACLTPLFPRIFLLVGPPGSGKSTFSILASKLISDDNLSMVEPHEFDGFLMESMVGKLVNISTDIRTNKPIDDAMLKKIEDRVPVRIDRKFKKAVMAWLPAIHIFGCNKLPPNYEGDTKAFTRRTTILELKSFKAQGQFNRNFANEVFDANPGGVLNFALEGLNLLLENGGHFSQPESGVERLEAWQEEYDPIGMFIKECKEGEIIVKGQTKLVFGPGAKIERSLLWNLFVDWHYNALSKPPRFSKHKFYEKIRSFVTETRDKTSRYFWGLGVIESGDNIL